MPEAIRVVGNTLYYKDATYRCALGRSGVIAPGNKREGDGYTPQGVWPLRECWYRPDKVTRPSTALPIQEIKRNDGWCDDAQHALYNRHFIIDAGAKNNQGMLSFEHLWRDDGRYDVIVPLGYNDDPIVAGKGSAIFLHMASPEYTPTEGCVALHHDDLLALLPELTTDMLLRIEA